MYLTKVFARVYRRAAGALTALALTAALAGLAAPAAHADTNQPLTQVTWVIDDLLNGGADPHQQYWNMIADLHRHSGHDYFRDNVDETTRSTQSQLIQVSVWRYGTYQGALYFWANNLYLAGFYQPGNGGGHYAFNDPASTARFNQVLGVQARVLPWTGNYSTLPGGSARQNQQINGPRLDSALQQLHQANTLLQSANGRDLLGQSLVMMIQATSEAARFGRVFDNIRGNIRDHGGAQIGIENADLEQNWGNISNWIYRVLQNPGIAPLQIGTGAFHRSFATLAQLMAYLSYVELHSGSRPQP